MAEADSAQSRRPRKPRAKPASGDPQLDTPDPVEIAMKAVAAGAVPGSAAQIVLEKHAHLIDVQCRREQEELGNVRVQRITRWLILAAVAAVLLGIMAILFNASQSRSLVIEPFDVPPGLQQRGITGKVVSARLLDRLSDLQRRTESSRAESSYANNWEDQIQVAVPETGISLGEIWRSLRRWLGEETRIGGEVVQTPAGLAITARAGSLTGGTVEGPELELNRLLDESAAAIYLATQPYRYAISLPPDRVDETERVLLSLVDHPDVMERKWAYSGLSVTYRGRGDHIRAIAMAQESIALDDDMFPAWSNLGSAYLQLGHDEAALAAYDQSSRIAREGLGDEFDARIVAANRNFQGSYSAWRVGDSQEALRMAQGNLRGTSRNFRLGSYAYAIRALSQAHDHGGVVRLASRADFSPEEAAGFDWLSVRIWAVLARALDQGDRPTAIRALERLMQSADQSVEQARGLYRGSFANGAVNFRARSVWPTVALALAAVGRGEEAAALAARTPADCYDCVVARAVAASAQGRRAQAEHWFREAARQGPSIPMADQEWGMMLFRSGDLGGAAPRFERAHALGPRWAEPLKALGDVLVRRDSWEEAERRYREAAERAPRWGALHMAWARALWRLGRHDEARQKLRLAGTMDLGGRDRARLQDMIRLASL